MGERPGGDGAYPECFRHGERGAGGCCEQVNDGGTSCKCFKGGAQQLMSKPVKTLEDLSAVHPGDMMVMACPKCKDVTVHYVEPTFKATEPKDKVKTRHECPGCEHKIVSEGHGKMKTDKIVHACK